ncbi:MAG TPA: 2-C-methyl-D-erythritol 4-phosphate cytidylyltransferase [Actinomycetota bacterium]|nr:2-C-methyl-D-erythritol 4-phosphate cytidylyltransferase [Actinomycetota bacterium]
MTDGPPSGDADPSEPGSEVGVAAILLAAGSGSRIGGDRPKAFLGVGGRSLLTMSAEAACGSSFVTSLVVVVPEGWEGRAGALVPSGIGATIVVGGSTRQDSVRLALAALPASTGVVVVHDAARVLASSALFDAVVSALASDEAAAGAIPVVTIPDTVKRVDDGWVAETVDRSGLVIAQTPQAFHAPALAAAHERAAADGLLFTDDAALMEWAGERIRVVPGEPGNFKVTTPDDLERLAAR